MADQRSYRGCVDEIMAALDDYASDIEKAPLKVSTKHAYITHAQRFVRWLNGEKVIPSQTRDDD